VVSGVEDQPVWRGSAGQGGEVVAQPLVRWPLQVVVSIIETV
jgi:hypothetical protein